MSDSPIPCDLLVSGGIILTLDAERRILWDGAIAVTGNSHLVRVIRNRRRAIRLGAGGMRSRALKPLSK